MLAKNTDSHQPKLWFYSFIKPTRDCAPL